MIWQQLISISIGATLGAWLRWGLAHVLNPLFPSLPLGTLGANLVGSYLIGMVLPITIDQPIFNETTRLAVTTGFLGALTTFSTFSAETMGLLARGEYVWSLACVAAHLGGSLGMTVLGILTVRYFAS